jgi:lipopolysaccharide export system permease protein
MVVLVVLSLALCITVFIYLLKSNAGVIDALSFTVVLLVASIPLAIEIVTTTTLALGSHELVHHGAIVSLTEARGGSFGSDESWTLTDVQRTEFNADPARTPKAERTHVETLRWPTEISAEMVAAAVLRPERMGTIDLFQYVRHLQSNGQSAQKYEIQFWKKVFYPLSCLVMVVLSLPFAYLHFRSGSIAGYTFGGVMAGISFVLLNNVMNDLGNLQGWQPWLTAALPGLIYSFFSLTAFTWLVLRR